MSLLRPGVIKQHKPSLTETRTGTDKQHMAQVNTIYYVYIVCSINFGHVLTGLEASIAAYDKLRQKHLSAMEVDKEIGPCLFSAGKETCV